MKPILLIAVVFTLLLAACQSAAPATTEAPPPIKTQIVSPTQVDKTQETSPETSPEPTDNGPYPGAVEPTQYDPNQAPPYQAPGEGGASIEWDEAANLILSGEVAQVTQFENLQVILVLKDGQTKTTRQPAMDEVLNLIDQCGDSCKDIKINQE